MEIIYIILAILIGAVIGWLFGKPKSSALATRIELLSADLESAKSATEGFEARISSLSQQLSATAAERDRLSYELESLSREANQTKADAHEKLLAETHHFEQLLAEKDKAHAAAIEAQEKRHREALDAMQHRFDETIAKVEAQLKTTTDSMLKERQKEFSEASASSIGQIVTPLRETIDKMKLAINDSTVKQASMSSALKENIDLMLRQSQAAQRSADELARAFKHGTKVQGDWGETILDELLQSQGLTKGIHYDTQATIKDAHGTVVKSDDGSMLRPDVILHLDQRREVIIDSKVSLSAFIDYVNAESDDDRQRFLKLHLESLSKHVKELSTKDYSSYIQPPKVKMDYVIMFVPNTGALWTAINAQPDLWRRAMEKNVYIADEQTLFAALRIINLTWTQIAQAQNHERVFELANEMLNRVGQFWKEYEAMGKALRKVNDAYDSARSKISEGGQSINTTANKLIKLGARQNDKNPLPQLIDIDNIPQIQSPEITVQPLTTD